MYDSRQGYKYKLKQLDWSKMPVGIAVRVQEKLAEFRGAYYKDNTGKEARCFLDVRMRPSKLHYSELLSEVKLAPADQQPWLLWRGGECPVPSNVAVEVECRDGVTGTSAYSWKHSKNGGDIIAYRIVGLK